MQKNPDQWQNLFPQKRSKFTYHLRHGRVSPKNVDSKAQLLESITEDLRNFSTYKRNSI